MTERQPHLRRSTRYEPLARPDHRPGAAVRRRSHLVSDLKLRVTSWGGVLLDKREMTKVMRAAGNEVRSKSAKLINQNQGGGRLYFGPSGRYRASVAGSPPVRVSGDLRSSLKTFAFKSGLGFAVRARQFYALFLEAGA